MLDKVGIENRKTWIATALFLITSILIQVFPLPSVAAEYSTEDSLREVRRVAVLTFETTHIGASGRTASDLFNAFLVRTCPEVSVMERTQLEKLLAEQSLQHATGLVDQETAARLKSLLGVDSIVIGSVVALEHDMRGGGTLMMTARLVDTSSGRILWAETRTAVVRESGLRRFWRFFSDPPPVSDHLVTGRLLELASSALVSELGRRLPQRGQRTAPSARAEGPAVMREAAACSRAEAGVTRLGESILRDEALYWAHRLKAGDSMRVDPGAAYADTRLREGLTNKILFWLGEESLPPLESAQLERIAEAKAAMKDLRMQCPRVSAMTPSPSETLIAAAPSR